MGKKGRGRGEEEKAVRPTSSTPPTRSEQQAEVFFLAEDKDLLPEQNVVGWVEKREEKRLGRSLSLFFLLRCFFLSFFPPYLFIRRRNRLSPFCLCL